MASTRADIRDAARALVDQDASTFPTDAQYNVTINRAANRVFLDMVSAGWPPNISTTTITANGTTQTYAWGGTDSVLGATLVYTNFGGQQLELKRVNPGHVHVLRSTQATGQFSEYYEVRQDINTGPIVELFPKVAGTYYVDYIPGFNGFASDSDVWRGPYGTDELLILYAASFGARKEGRAGDAESFRKEYDDRLYDLKRLASWFDQRNPAMIRQAAPSNQRLHAFDYFASPNQGFDF